MRWRALLWSALLLALAARAAAPVSEIPWLWDRTWAVPAQATEVALLVDNIELRGAGMRHRPRGQSPFLASGVRVTPVVHVELNRLEPPQAPARFHAQILQSVLAAAARSSSGWVQLDYEARPSGRAAYRQLVQEIRQALPAQVRLSVTALAWWCQGGAWLDTLAADEVVPMFFRMGRDAQRLRALVREEPEKLNPRCRATAIGLARQEPQLDDLAPRYARRYRFDYQGWKDAAVSSPGGGPRPSPEGAGVTALAPALSEEGAIALARVPSAGQSARRSSP